MPPPVSSDCVVVGGGVIGLSIAYQLAQDGVSVTLLERGLATGREASWAGAGILPPGSWYSDHPALDALAEAARTMYPRWSAALLEETGSDNEYWPCGASYVETPANSAYLRAAFDRWRSQGVVVEAEVAPGAADRSWRVPGEAQVRNPRHLRALDSACRLRGVRIVTDAPAERVERVGDRIEAITTPVGRFYADAYCLAAGCWTPEIAGGGVPGRPIRGQMLLLRPRRGPGRPALTRIVHRYPHYLVPRRDGRVLVGATVEDVGFEDRTTAGAREELLAVAAEIEPSLAEAEVEASWSGLRPWGGGDLPQIGPLPDVENGWVATGHYRSGLQLAPPTARLISDLIRGREPFLPVNNFLPNRIVPVSM